MRIVHLQILCACALFCVTPVFSQDYTPFSSFSVGLRASTLGVGVEAATPLEEHFTLRAGFNVLPADAGTWNVALPDDNDNVMSSAFGYVPEYRATPKLSMIHGNILVDYHPAGIFHVTAGVYLGQSKASVKGYLVDWRDKSYPKAQLLPGYEWPTIDIDGQKVSTTNGEANLDLSLGNIVKPYLGIGVGRALPKNNRVSFKFELGVLYQGNYNLKQNGESLNLSASDDDDIQDAHKILGYTKFWPMMNFQIAYRIL